MTDGFSLYAESSRWKRHGGPRPAQRSDGFPTRLLVEWMTSAELAIHKAIEAVEAAGESASLTEAAVLLCKARERVADHVEGQGHKGAAANDDVGPVNP